MCTYKTTGIFQSIGIDATHFDVILREFSAFAAPSDAIP